MRNSVKGAHELNLLFIIKTVQISLISGVCSFLAQICAEASKKSSLTYQFTRLIQKFQLKAWSLLCMLIGASHTSNFAYTETSGD